MNNAIIRQQQKALRRALAPDVRAELSAAITAQVLLSDVFMAAKYVACYHAFGGEVDTRAIINACWAQNKICCLPVLITDQLNFVAYHPHTSLRKNRFGFAEPQPQTQPIAAEQLDLVITPMVAFTAAGYRLGMGAGYYDRHFAFRQQTAAPPYLLGIAYEFQRVDRFTIQAWDVVMDSVMTQTMHYHRS